MKVLKMLNRKEILDISDKVRDWRRTEQEVLVRRETNREVRRTSYVGEADGLQVVAREVESTRKVDGLPNSVICSYFLSVSLTGEILGQEVDVYNANNKTLDGDGAIFSKYRGISSQQT